MEFAIRGNGGISLSRRRRFTSESVAEGHPDKVADQISDAVLDALLERDRSSRVACETLITTGLVLVTGEISTEAYVEIPAVVRNTVRDIGYTGSECGFDADTCAVLASIDEQSPDIARGVARLESASYLDSVGAGDQGIVYGYASDETPELMPLPIALAHRLVRRLSVCRREGIIPSLRPDGKSQCTVQYDSEGRPEYVSAVVVSAQHDPSVDDMEEFREMISSEVIDRVVPSVFLGNDTRYYINPTGRFATGGPVADTGVTGRKIVVDSYGGRAHHGGGCFSGKDATKVDRSASYAARHAAKNVVAAGLARECEVEIAYAIGVAYPVSLRVDTFGTGEIPEERIEALIEEFFDFRPAAIIEGLDLRRPIYRPTAVFGHFGRTDIAATWEQTDRAVALRDAAGLRGRPPEPAFHWPADAGTNS
ncbi:MAG: methionine adenosyltransferase [Bacillota bacterium]